MAPANCSGGPMSSSGARRQRHSTTTLARYATAFSPNTSQAPTAAMRAPPTAGPMARPRLMLAPPSVSACFSSRAGTSSGWIAWYAGPLNAVQTPRAKVKPSRTSGVMPPAAVTTARAAATTRPAAWVASSSRRRSTRSASAPATTPTSTTGRNVAVWTRAMIGRRGVQLHHEPRGADGLHPGADAGRQEGEPQGAVHGVPKRRPRGHGRGRGAHRVPGPGRPVVLRAHGVRPQRGSCCRQSSTYFASRPSPSTRNE